MFARMSRLFRAWMGYFISIGEDPEVMLQDAIEEMRMTMPKLNSVLVATRATVIRLEEERDALLQLLETAEEGVEGDDELAARVEPLMTRFLFLQVGYKPWLVRRDSSIRRSSRGLARSISRPAPSSKGS